MVEVICEASVSQLSKLKSCRRAPPLPLRSQDGARLGQVVSMVLHCIFLPFAVRHLGTFSALNSAGSVRVNALSQSFSKCGPRTTGGPPVPRNGPRRPKVNYCDISNIQLRTKRTQSVGAKSIKELPNLLTRSWIGGLRQGQ